MIGLLNGDFDGPVIAWRADMDAFRSEEALDKPYKSQMPGVKHVCGHDVHTTIGLGIAEVLVPGVIICEVRSNSFFSGRKIQLWKRRV